jgi:hypothetical protein
MFKVYSSRSPVLLAPPHPAKARVKVATKESRALVTQTIYHVTGTALVIVVELGMWALQEAVMVKQFQPP